MSNTPKIGRDNFVTRGADRPSTDSLFDELRVPQPDRQPNQSSSPRSSHQSSYNDRYSHDHFRDHADDGDDCIHYSF
jgi:hypothetical protein